jgi:hypothetical protein
MLRTHLSILVVKEEGRGTVSAIKMVVNLEKLSVAV